MNDEARFSSGDTILSPDAMCRIRFVVLPPREESTWVPQVYHGPPDWWFRFGLHYVLMAAIVAAGIGCLALAIFFLSGGAR